MSPWPLAVQCPRPCHRAVLVPSLARRLTDYQGVDITVNTGSWNVYLMVGILAVLPPLIGWLRPWATTTPTAPPAIEAVEQAPAEASAPDFVQPPPAATGAVDDIASPAAESPATTSPPSPSLSERITRYRVRYGDTLEGLAARFGISVQTLMWANGLRDPNRLYAGQELTVLPVSGVLHTVRPGETVPALAERYGVALDELANANGLVAPYTVRPGERLLVPGGRPLGPVVAAPPRAEAGAAFTRPPEAIAWPAPGTGDRFREQFIAAAVPIAQESQRRTQVPASVIIAQAIHESYWGTSKLAREANNLFGIKARNGQGSAGVYWMDAWEVIDGSDVVVPEPFRAYLTPDDSFIDHGLFFHQNSRYWGAFAYKDDPRAFAQAIAAAGYATDPAYAAKLIRIMDQWNLYQYDLP